MSNDSGTDYRRAMQACDLLGAGGCGRQVRPAARLCTYLPEKIPPDHVSQLPVSDRSRLPPPPYDPRRAANERHTQRYVEPDAQECRKYYLGVHTDPQLPPPPPPPLRCNPQPPYPRGRFDMPPPGNLIMPKLDVTEHTTCPVSVQSMACVCPRNCACRV